MIIHDHSSTSYNLPSRFCRLVDVPLLCSLSIRYTYGHEIELFWGLNLRLQSPVPWLPCLNSSSVFIIFSFPVDMGSIFVTQGPFYWRIVRLIG